MRVLVTNDDGVASEGLHVLTIALAAGRSRRVRRRADSDRSGTGAAIGLVHADQHLDAQRVEVPGCDGIDSWAIDGPPGMCVIVARLGAFGDPPDVVVAGINPGLNTGRAILHSGTVGAMLTAQNFGGSGLAVSTDFGSTWHWDTVARFVVEVFPRLLEAPTRTVLNLNVPALFVRRGRWRALGAKLHFRRRAAVADTPDGVQFELRSVSATPAPDSDTGTVAAGFASLTTIVGIAEAWPPDVYDTGDVLEGVVPGASLEPVHAIPDGSRPRSAAPSAAAPRRSRLMHRTRANITPSMTPEPRRPTWRPR